MESRNPVFGRSEEFARGGYATFDTRTPSSDDLQGMYDAPSATRRNTARMTIDDVVIRTASLFGVLLVTAIAVFALFDTSDPALFPVIIGGAIVGLVLSLVISFSKKIRPPLMFAYAVAEGLFVGGISLVFESSYNGIVTQAILGTLGAFTAMLVLYKTGVVKNSPKFTKTLMIAGAATSPSADQPGRLAGQWQQRLQQPVRLADRRLRRGAGLVLPGARLRLRRAGHPQRSAPGVLLDRRVRPRGHAGLAVHRDPAPARDPARRRLISLIHR